MTKKTHQHVIGPFEKSKCPWCAMGLRPVELVEEVAKVRRLAEIVAARASAPDGAEGD